MNLTLFYYFSVAHEYLQRKLQCNKLFPSLQTTTLAANFVFAF
jgi:hypothetical protein